MNKPSQRPLQLLTVAELTWQNGLEYALEGVHLAHRDGIDLRYTLVGQGLLLESLAFLRHDFDMENICCLIPAQNHHASPSKTAIFLIPVVKAGCFPPSRLRAYRRVIATRQVVDLGDFPAGIEIHLVPRWDAGAIAQTIRNIFRELDHG